MTFDKVVAALLGVLTDEEHRALESAIPRVYLYVKDQLRDEPILQGATVLVTVAIRHPKLAGPIQQSFELAVRS